jgi:hypothetical protein
MDCVTTVKSGEPIKNNSSSVLWAYTIMNKDIGLNKFIPLSKIEENLTNRFDDPDYYPKRG